MENKEGKISMELPLYQAHLVCIEIWFGPILQPSSYFSEHNKSVNKFSRNNESIDIFIFVENDDV